MMSNGIIIQFKTSLKEIITPSLTGTILTFTSKYEGHH